MIIYFLCYTECYIKYAMSFYEPVCITTIKHCCVTHLYALFHIRQCTACSVNRKLMRREVNNSITHKSYNLPQQIAFQIFVPHFPLNNKMITITYFQLRHCFKKLDKAYNILDEDSCPKNLPVSCCDKTPFLMYSCQGI